MLAGINFAYIIDDHTEESNEEEGNRQHQQYRQTLVHEQRITGPSIYLLTQNMLPLSDGQ